MRALVNRGSVDATGRPGLLAKLASRCRRRDGGRVAEEGTRQELMAAGGFYRKLNDAKNVDPNLVRGAAQPRA